mmetsp:Transcript_99133/g.171933  ORF Transcript_99133/g.171933 Transcript_99133/m.171933 type:complete len:1052 (+) Transcript_99133:84-3239(+)
MAVAADLEERQLELDKALSKQVGLDYGLALFDEHSSGMKLSQESSSILRDAAEVLKSFPAWTVVLEGHCPGRPEENNLIRESVGEEAADLCKDYLQKAGVANNILCEGRGSAQGLGGMCVRMSAVAPKVVPGTEESPAKAGDSVEETPITALSQDTTGDPLEDLIRETAADVAPDEEAQEDSAKVAPAPDSQEDTKAVDEPAAKVDETIAVSEVVAQKDEEDHGIVHAETSGDILRAETHGDLHAIVTAETSRSLADRIEHTEQQSHEAGVEMLSPPGKAPQDNHWTQAGIDLIEKAGAASALGNPVVGSLATTDQLAAALAAGYAVSSLLDSGALEKKTADDAALAETLTPAKGVETPRDRPKLHSAETRGSFGGSQLTAMNNTGDLDINDLSLPDTSQMSMEEKMALMDKLMDKILETSIAFEPNKADIHRRGKTTVRQLAKVMQSFPTFTVRCVGHSKGRPADNNDAKKQLAQARAEAVKAALLKEGVANDIICSSYGSALGRGMCVRLHALSRAEMEDGEMNVPRTDNMNPEQQEASLNQLLKEALDKGLAFEPNKASIQADGAPVIKQVHSILKGFPNWMIRCEGHAKGLPADNNDAKQQLSQVRAEAVRAALEALGTTNPIYCQGLGSTHGLGMCVRMFAMDPDKDIEIPDVTGKSTEERSQVLDSLLERVLERNIEFEPNKSEIPTSASATVNSLARVLKAFPDFTLRCEGHTKGLPTDNNEAKRKLSHARAESIKTAVKAKGVNNKISCIGVGSVQGRGMRVRMFVIDPEELKKDEITVPKTEGMSEEEQTALLNNLLETALQKNIDFEPNVYEVPATAEDTIQGIAEVLKAFPSFAIRCEGHAKGQPADNTEAKKKLSHMRAEAVKAAVIQEGATNSIHCVGEGCAKGLGMRVRMFVIDPEELKKDELQVPDTTGMEKETRRKLLNELLSKALEKNISFEPNKAHIQASGLDIVKSMARVLAAFPDFAVRCEGHAKGKPADNNEAKIKLSQVRAEAVATALSKEGVENKIVCVGNGCAQGVGMCVRMYAMEEGDFSESKPDA